MLTHSFNNFENVCKTSNDVFMASYWSLLFSAAVICDRSRRGTELVLFFFFLEPIQIERVNFIYVNFGKLRSDALDSTTYR